MNDEAREARNREGLLEARGQLLQMVPTYSHDELAALWQCSSTTAAGLTRDLCDARTIFAVRHRGRWCIPKLQFDQDVQPYPEVQQLLGALGAEASGWAVLQWFIEPNEHLDGRTPLESWQIDRGRVARAGQNANWLAQD